MEYKPRWLEGELLSLWEKKRLFVIRGPRRSGKTTLLKKLQEEKGGTYITFEHPSERAAFLAHPLEYVESYPSPLFLDEIQYLGEEGAQALKLVYDESDVKMVVSGSGAFDIAMKLPRYLVGRAYFFDLLPLSFGEYAAWHSPLAATLYEKGHKAFLALLEGEGEPPQPSPVLEELYRSYLVWGGYPEVVVKGKKELESIVATTIDEDIIRFFGLRERRLMWQTVRRLAVLMGKLLKWSTLGVSYKTAQEYVSILESSFVVRLLPAFSTNPLVELTKAEKVYFYDNGFRNALLQFFWEGDRPDKGELVENATFRQLLQLPYQLSYWRTKSKAEVDFILKTERGPIPVEAKHGGGKMPRSLLSFIERYKPPVAFLLSPEPFEKRVGETAVYGVPPYYL